MFDLATPPTMGATLAEWQDPTQPPPAAKRAGFRFGARGSHSSRTIMLVELGELLTALPEDATHAAYSEAVVADNALGKTTVASRRHSHQHLRELYGCDPRLPIFRILRRLWLLDKPGRPLLALLAALARDPVLRATVPAVLPLPPRRRTGPLLVPRNDPRRHRRPLPRGRPRQDRPERREFLVAIRPPPRAGAKAAPPC